MFASILVPIDVAHRSSWHHALPQALELATLGRSPVTVMTVVRELSAMFEGVYLSVQLERMMSDARTRLAHIVAEHRANGVTIAQDVRFGSIGHEILAAAKDCRADLIVMASHRPEMQDYLIGPNAAHVARHADCSVLVVRRLDGPAG